MLPPIGLHRHLGKENIQMDSEQNGTGSFCIDFGLKEWNKLDSKKIVRKYREFVYETGAVDAGKGAVIDQKIVDKERKHKYKVSRMDRFRYRFRYSPSETTTPQGEVPAQQGFTGQADARIIGSPVKSCPRQGAFGSFHRADKDFVGEAPVKWEDPNEMSRNFMGQEFYGVNLRSGHALASVQPQSHAPLPGLQSQRGLPHTHRPPPGRKQLQSAHYPQDALYVAGENKQ